MKTRIILFIALFLTCGSIAHGKEEGIRAEFSESEALNVYTSSDLYNLTLKWADEYRSLNPTLKVKVNKSTDDDIISRLNEGIGIGFVGDVLFARRSSSSMWSMVAAREVIVPVMNANNPLIAEICRRGLTQKAMSAVFENSGGQSWEMLFGNAPNGSAVPLNCYIANDPSVQSGVENFLKKNLTNDFKLIESEALVSTVRKDPAALGFCKLAQIIDPSGQHFIDQIKLVPIDKNGNGKIDYMEDIYDDLQTFARGIWIGKYPQALTNTIYAVSLLKPENVAEVAFLKWVLTDGQQFLGANGYSELVYNEKQSQLGKFNDTELFETESPKTSFAGWKVVLVLILALGLGGFVLNLFIRKTGKHRVTARSIGSESWSIFEEQTVIAPKGLYFDKTHTWAFMKKDGVVKVGVDDFMQHVTGPITRIEMKQAGEKINKGELLLTLIRKGKQLNIYSPVSGRIIMQNKNLETHSSLINSAPYGDGWVYEIEPINWLLEIQYLSMAEKYKAWLKNEFSRLRDFFATAQKADSTEYAYAVLQDGGALKDNVLADLGPEVWEDFQIRFIDSSK